MVGVLEEPGDVDDGAAVVVDAVCVCAIKACGVKVKECAAGAAELRDEYVSFRTSVLMLSRMVGVLLKQMLI